MAVSIPNQVNPELLPMIRQGLLNQEKVSILIELYEIVDRFATTLFTEEEIQERIKKETGVLPDIISWSDYFQTEVASRYFLESEDSLRKIVDTIRFDLISAHLIFSGKPEYFKNLIRKEALVSKGIDQAKWDHKIEESIHLDILLDYYENLGIGNKPLSLVDKLWYEGFQLNDIAI
ncbi:hypothetical protein LPTSP4_14700 [Leptospira ryugenii]|uniref:Uncharacterized protein n=1 Tax=Leptospira ryugenii TaxID=1917863 RepID=A0A2P2DZA2_9LEPT|nr:hypothetical protein [Leptospira ryugenii]GBF49949.1 hypothetical protein LPTSP4_14700 [Leptospira ryugenii]